MTIWILGPTSSGKTTIGMALVDSLRKDHFHTIHYDGDEIRGFFGPDLGFKKENRLKVVSAIVHLANKAAAARVTPVVSALTANVDAREYVRATSTNLFVVSLSCPLEVCITRDSRGLYKKAINGEIDPKTLIGFETPYPAIDAPDLLIDTSVMAPTESVAAIKHHLYKRLAISHD
jgi:adenylylsulfate kinase